MSVIDQDDVLDFTDGIKQKADLKFKEVTHNFQIRYNCIYWAYMGCNVGSEEGKHRPILITRTYSNSTICAVIPLTTQRLGDNFWYHIDIEQIDGTALVEQMRTIDIRRIEKPYMLAGEIASINKLEKELINTQIEYLYPIWRPELKTKYDQKLQQLGVTKVKVNS